MSGHHDHDGHDHGRGASGRRLAIALGITSSFTLAEVVGGLLTGSLALLADAAHMLSDNFSLALALFAIWLARRPATPNRSFGYQRAEILAALANGLTLVVVSVWILFEAYRRIEEPPEILGGWMLVVAVIGLGVNIAAGAVLYTGRGSSLNIDAAFRHVIADALGSVGVIAAALVIITTGWTYADPLISVVIALLIAASAWSVLRDSLRILLEAAPAGTDAAEIGRRLAGADGVTEVHDLHIWTITSGFPALSAHVLVGRNEDCHGRRRELERILHDEFGIEHTTLQVDHVAHTGDLVELGQIRYRGRSAADPAPREGV